jgi:pimeloyl-ACP methyl ester carboxylesterase
VIATASPPKSSSKKRSPLAADGRALPPRRPPHTISPEFGADLCRDFFSRAVALELSFFEAAYTTCVLLRTSAPWMGEGCSTAGEINGTLFQRGGKFGRPTLWLYGQHDSFYSIEHSRSNFDIFKKKPAATASLLNSQCRMGSATGSWDIQICGPGMSRNI